MLSSACVVSRGLLRGFGLKVGEISKGQFAARVRTLTAGHAMLERIAEAMLRAREALQTEFARLHRAMLALARNDEVWSCFEKMESF